MNKTDQTPYPSNTEWKRLGELELAAGANPEDTLQPWITETLIPFDLSPGFLHRIVQAAHESAMRYLHPDAGLAFGHIHLSIHAPARILTKGKTWGFFHVERIQNKASSAIASCHTIELYFYMEGG